jgi:hypothetical protein
VHRLVAMPLQLWKVLSRSIYRIPLNCSQLIHSFQKGRTRIFLISHNCHSQWNEKRRFAFSSKKQAATNGDNFHGQDFPTKVSVLLSQLPFPHIQRQVGAVRLLGSECFGLPRLICVPEIFWSARNERQNEGAMTTGRPRPPYHIEFKF